MVRTVILLQRAEYFCFPRLCGLVRVRGTLVARVADGGLRPCVPEGYCCNRLGKGNLAKGWAPKASLPFSPECRWIHWSATFSSPTLFRLKPPAAAACPPPRSPGGEKQGTALGRPPAGKMPRADDAGRLHRLDVVDGHGDVQRVPGNGREGRQR
ncbi:unnamed protein product [Ectocarpus sp. 4 AP-2014]